MKVTPAQRRELEAIVARRNEAAGLVRRARVILLSDNGVSGREIALRLDLSPEAVSRIRTRFRNGGISGLDEVPKAGRKDHAVPAATVERIIELAMSPPPAGRSRWTARLLAREVGFTPGCISDVLRKHEFKPHLSRTYKVSRDPSFVILDNSSTHGTPEVTAWLAANSRVHFHYTPTSASWLNQVEGFFGILAKQSLSETDFASKHQLRKHLSDYIRSWNKTPWAFAWTKPANAIIKSHRRMLDRISTTVH